MWFLTTDSLFELRAQPELWRNFRLLQRGLTWTRRLVKADQRLVSFFIADARVVAQFRCCEAQVFAIR